MPRILWGLDLGEITLSKFGTRNTFNSAYHLRCTKMVLFQLAMLLCSCANGLAQTLMILYLQRKAHPKAYIQSVLEYNIAYLQVYDFDPDHVELNVDNLVAVVSLNIMFSFATSCIFTTAWFLDLVWPERKQSHRTRTIWKAVTLFHCFVGMCDVVAMTVVVASQGAVVFEDKTLQGIRVTGLEPIHFYQYDSRVVAAVCVLWPAWASVVAATGAMLASHCHDERFGPFSKKANRGEKDSGRLEGGLCLSGTG